MMFKWCSYCQAFLGEKAPYTDYQISHGICEKCESNATAFSEDAMQGSRELAGFYAKVLDLGRKGNPEDCAKIIEESVKRNLKFSDLCIGLLQPALYEIGKQWESGIVSVADEHKFTSWCEHILAMAPEYMSPPETKTDVLICPIAENFHTLGVRFLGQWLRDSGYHAQWFYPGIPYDEILKLVHKFKPRVLCISMGCQPDMQEAENCWNALKPLADAQSLKVAFGGLVCKLNQDSSKFDIPWCKTNEELLSLLPPRRDTTDLGNTVNDV